MSDDQERRSANDSCVTELREARDDLDWSDAKTVTRYVDVLRAMPDDEAWEHIRQQPRFIELARRCLSAKHCFRELLEKGLDNPDASGIKMYLEVANTKLGARYVLHTLRERLDTEPATVEMALYHLPALVPQQHKAAMAALRELESSCPSLDELIREGRVHTEPTPAMRADADAVLALVAPWHEVRRWAEEMLRERLDINDPTEVRRGDRRGKHRLPGTDWW